MLERFLKILHLKHTESIDIEKNISYKKLMFFYIYKLFINIYFDIFILIVVIINTLLLISENLYASDED
jgi:hypothetical protein